MQDRRPSKALCELLGARWTGDEVTSFREGFPRALLAYDVAEVGMGKYYATAALVELRPERVVARPRSLTCFLGGGMALGAVRGRQYALVCGGFISILTSEDRANPLVLIDLERATWAPLPTRHGVAFRPRFGSSGIELNLEPGILRADLSRGLRQQVRVDPDALTFAPLDGCDVNAELASSVGPPWLDVGG